jgi:3-oxoacyl-[acyl-carrier-protein] synthase II
MRDALVVTGYGCVTPLGEGAAALYGGWRDGRRAIAPVRRFDTSGLEVRIGGEMPDPRGQPRGALRGAAHLETALAEALASSGLPPGIRPAILVATTKGFLESGAEVAARAETLDAGLPARWLVERLASGRGDRFGAASSPGGLPPGAATVSTACSSGTAALALAWSRRGALEEGRFDAILIAGVDLLSDFVFRGFSALRAMDPAPCRPFDVRRAGMSAAEAAAVLILETAGAARARGAPARGFLLGGGLGGDAIHPTAPSRDGRGMAVAVAGALRTSRTAPSDLGHVHAHGTATVFNDSMELRALERALGPEAREAPLTTVKGSIGHAFGPAGLVEVIASLEAVGAGFLPGVAGLEAPEAGWPVLSSGISPRGPRFLKLGAGFGGFNAAVVMEGIAP